MQSADNSDIKVCNENCESVMFDSYPSLIQRSLLYRGPFGFSGALILRRRFFVDFLKVKISKTLYRLIDEAKKNSAPNKKRTPLV